MKIIRILLLFCLCCSLLVFFTSCATKPSLYTSVEPKDIVCLGDSITSGWKLPDPGRQSFPSLLASMTRNKWRVMNAGVPGATALKKGDIPIWKEQVFGSVMASRPDTVVLMLGTNDTKDKNWRYIESYTADYSELVEKLKSLPSNPQVFVCSLPPILVKYRGGMSAERASQLTTQVREIARVTQTHYVDIGAALANKPQLFIDGLHPNIQGAKVIAEKLIQEITSQ